MSILFIASVLLGVFVIAARGPLIFAPAETLQFVGRSRESGCSLRYRAS